MSNWFATVLTILRIIRATCGMGVPPRYSRARRRCHKMAELISFANQNMLLIRHLTNVAALHLIISMSLAPAADTRPETRKLVDNLAQEPEHKPREMRVPIELNDREIKSAPKTLFPELPLTGKRGQETPSGSKYGRYCENAFERAGFPNCIGRFAKPSTDAYHQVGYVGGGTLFGGTNRRKDEGTFGMDYAGYWFHRKTWLKWSHGGRHQGGAGRYETEGPRLLPE